MTPRQFSGVARDSPFSTTLTCGCDGCACAKEIASGSAPRAGATNVPASGIERKTPDDKIAPNRADLVACLMVSICGDWCGENTGDKLTLEILEDDRPPTGRQPVPYRSSRRGRSRPCDRPTDG